MLYGGPQWFKTAKNRELITGPIACPFPRSLGPLTHLLDPHCSLCSRAPLRSFVCSLAYSLTIELMEKKKISRLKLQADGPGLKQQQRLSSVSPPLAIGEIDLNLDKDGESKKDMVVRKKSGGTKS